MLFNEAPRVVSSLRCAKIDINFAAFTTKGTDRAHSTRKPEQRMVNQRISIDYLVDRNFSFTEELKALRERIDNVDSIMEEAEVNKEIFLLLKAHKEEFFQTGFDIESFFDLWLTQGTAQDVEEFDERFTQAELISYFLENCPFGEKFGTFSGDCVKLEIAIDLFKRREVFEVFLTVDPREFDSFSKFEEAGLSKDEYYKILSFVLNSFISYLDTRGGSFGSDVGFTIQRFTMYVIADPKPTQTKFFPPLVEDVSDMDLCGEFRRWGSRTKKAFETVLDDYKYEVEGTEILNYGILARKHKALYLSTLESFFKPKYNKLDSKKLKLPE